MTTLLISDLHLDAQRPHITEKFLNLLAGEARGADAVYILGDLFEAWVGDDDDDTHKSFILNGLRALTGSGVPCHVMHGNRDFLFGSGFEARTGCQLLAEPAVLDLHGIPTVLLHGDVLCTDDVEYQAFRRQVRDPAWQEQFLAQSLIARRDFARKARAASSAHTGSTKEAIMDTNAEAVAALFRETGAARMIHGHTHRPAIHRPVVDGEPRTRIVLGDWYHQASVLRCDGAGCRLSLQE